MSVALVGAMLAGAMIPWWPIYESPAFFVAAAAAILIGSAIAVVGTRRRWPAWGVVVAVVAAYLVVGVPVAVPERALFGVLPTPAGLLELVAGAALSWKQLVTIAVPVGSYQSLLVPPFLLGLVCATLTATIALRSRYPAAAALPPALLFVAGIALGVVHLDIALQAGLIFLVTVVAWLVRVAIARRRAITRVRRVEGAVADARRVLGASVLIAVTLIGATAGSIAMPGPARNVVRAELQPPFEPQEHDSPLAGFRTAFREGEAERVMLEVTGLPPGAGIRIAALDTYDGVVYSVGGGDRNALSGRFARVPYQLDQTEATGTREDIAVEVADYDEVWVPGIGQLERITFAGPDAVVLTDEYFYNDVTATGAVQHGLEAGDRYEAVSKVPVPAGDLTELEPGTSVLPPAPELPPELERLLERWAPASGEPGLRLAQLIGGFEREGYVSHGLDDEPYSRSGHSLDRLIELATDQPMLGDGEQYAVAAALMARRIGFPARVVVGYMAQPETPTDDATGALQLRSADRQAWIEVQTADGAWVAVDPNPTPREVPDEEPDQPTIVSRPQSALPPLAERTPVDDYDADPDPAPDDGSDDDGWLAVLLGVVRIAGFVILGLAVLVSPFLAIIVAKLRRRRLRRRAPTPVERIEGGWDEFADIASDYGYAISATATRAEQAATVGGLGPLVLASVVDRAVFAPNGPGDDDDHRVWHTVDELAQRLGESRSPRDRLRAAVSLSSLGGYAVTRKGGRA
ncbi:transglutaminase-like domain-containing protein [Agromyces neolithicus]|uniref:transglutaminase-like domain-containing protein n=1 Tax=Agromyces neolithicus TaxID=269420 RepID=UPI0031DF72E0